MTTAKSSAISEVNQDSQSASRLVFVLLFAFFLCNSLFRADTFLSDGDTFWHIAAGAQVWHTGSFPRVDDWSHTFQGHPWIANGWLAELILFGAYDLGGWRTVALVSACTIAATYALLYLILARQMRLTVAIGVATTAYLFSSGHFLARPHIFSFPLLIIWFSGLVDAIEAKMPPRPYLLLVMLLWANIHGGFTLALGLAALLGAEAVLQSDPGLRFRVAARWGGFLVAALACACATPYGYQTILIALQFLGGNEAVPFIREWQPLFAESTPGIKVFVMALLFLALYYGIKVPFWRLAAVIMLIYLMLSYVRFAPWFFAVTPILLISPLTKQFHFLRFDADLAVNQNLFEALARISRRALYPACSVVMIAIVVFAFYGPALSSRPDIAPTGAVDYVVDHNLRGNIYNPYDFGAYLIFRGIKTFIDSRTDQLFSEGFASSVSRTLHQEPSAFIAMLQKYDVSLALVKPHSIESIELERSSGWKKVYSDAMSQLYVKNDL
jgi:hypothetical protein